MLNQTSSARGIPEDYHCCSPSRVRELSFSQQQKQQQLKFCVGLVEGRKYEQMTLVEDKDQVAGSSAGLKRRGNVEEEFSGWKKKLRIGEIGNFSPGSNSDITTEYMADSSKSSCLDLDDACTTLALEPGGVAAAAAGAAAGSGAAGVDLNDDNHLSTTPLDEQDDERRRGLESYGRDEVSADIIRDKGTELQDWLQLGLGPCSRAGQLVSPARTLAAVQANADEDDDDSDDDDGRQKRALRLFPCHSDYGVSQRMPSSPAEVEVPRGVNNQAMESSTKFSLRLAPSPSSEVAEDQGGFVKQYPRMTAHPDTQLVVSYNTMGPSSTTSTHHSIRTSSSPPSFALEQQRQRLGMGMFTEIGLPPYHETSAFSSLSDSAQQQRGFAYGVSEANFPQDDKHFFRIAGTGLMPRSSSSMQQQQQQEQLFPSSFPPFSSRPSPPPGLYASAAAPTIHLPPLYSSSTRNQPEDWQALVKKLGGSMNFQTLYSSKPGAEATEELLQPVRSGSSNLQDLQAQWSNHWRGGGGGGFFGQESSLGLSRSRTAEAVSLSRYGPPNPRAWQRSGLQLPYLPVHGGTLTEPPRSKEKSVKLPAATLAAAAAAAGGGGGGGDGANDLWFFLRSESINQDSGQQLPQIRKGYLRLKDGTVPVSYVKKYLAHKLGLLYESEVEISCRGQVLTPSMSLQHVRDVIWHSNEERGGTMIHQNQQKQDHHAAHHHHHQQQQQQQQQQILHQQQQETQQQHTAKNIVMELSYRRKQR